MKNLFVYFSMLAFSYSFAQNYEWVRGGKFLGSTLPFTFSGIDANRNQYLRSEVIVNEFVWEHDTLADFSPICSSVIGTMQTIMSMSPSGNMRWAKSLSCASLGSNFIEKSFTDRDGNTYLIGTFVQDFHFDGIQYGNYSSAVQDFVLKLDSMGTVLWFREIEALTPAPSQSYDKDNIILSAVSRLDGDVHILAEVHGDFQIGDSVIQANSILATQFDRYLVALDAQTGDYKWSESVLDTVTFFTKGINYDLQGNIITLSSHRNMNNFVSIGDSISVKKFQKNNGNLLWETILAPNTDVGSWFNVSNKQGQLYIGVNRIIGSFWSSTPYLYQLDVDNGSIDWAQTLDSASVILELDVCPISNNVYYHLATKKPSYIKHNLRGFSAQTLSTVLDFHDSNLDSWLAPTNLYLTEVENRYYTMDYCGDYYYSKIQIASGSAYNNMTLNLEYNNIYPNGKENKIFKLSVENQCGSTVSIAEKEQSSLLLYPNPTENSLHISHSAIEAEIEIWDSFGHRVLGKRIKQEEEIETEGLSAGIYILKLHSDRGNFVQKFVKK